MEFVILFFIVTHDVYNTNSTPVDPDTQMLEILKSIQDPEKIRSSFNML